MAGFKLFGFQILPPGSKDSQNTDPAQITQKAISPPNRDDGAITITSGGFFGSYVDMEGTIRGETELITRYREMAMQPELETAIDDIVNESIVVGESGTSIEIIVDELAQPAQIKKRIQDEFKNVLKLLDWANSGHDLFRRWYIDGRIFYQVLIDETNPSLGIKEVRYIDPRRVRKIREITKDKDPATGADIIKSISEYYIYNERGIIGAHANLGLRISPDSIVNINSGLMDSRRGMVLSYLHKCIKPLNQLRMIEDAMVIYKLSRAPSRRVFYIDVGNLARPKAEQYLTDIMTKYRNKVVYDASTGEIRDDRKYLSILEDFWLPRRGNGRATEIQTLQGGESLGEMEDVHYFEKKLYKSLNVPVSRLDPQEGFSLGRVAEITRDELKFTKFVQKLRNKFSVLFDELMKRQLALKGVCTEGEWETFKEVIWYDFLKDNNFTELKEAELWNARLDLLMKVDPFMGRFFSSTWTKKHVLNQTDEQIEEMAKEIEEDKKNGVFLPGEVQQQQSEMALQQAQGGPQEQQPQEQSPASGTPSSKIAGMRIESSGNKEKINTIKKVLRERNEQKRRKSIIENTENE